MFELIVLTNFESRLVLLVAGIIIFFLYNVYGLPRLYEWLHNYRFVGGAIYSQKTRRYLGISAFIFLNILIVSSIAFLIQITFLRAPYLVSPVSQQTLEYKLPDAGLDLTFSQPVKSDSLDIDDTFGNKYDVQIADGFLNKLFKTRYRITPRTPPGFGQINKLRIKSDAWLSPFDSTLTREYKVVTEPVILDIESEKVGQESIVTITYDQDMDAFDVTYGLGTGSGDPKIEKADEIHRITTITTSSGYIDITPQIRTRAFNLSGVEVYGERVTLSSYSVSSDNAPFLISFSHDKSPVDPVADITLTFNQPMDQEATVAGIEITPEVLGDFEWISERELAFKPQGSLALDTDYRFTIKSATSASADLSYIPIIRDFRTAGELEVLTVSPGDGGSVKSTNLLIEITYSQPVDHESFEKLFKISPAISGGTIGWVANRMQYRASNIAAGTEYTVTVEAGLKPQFGAESKSPLEFSFKSESDFHSVNVPWYGNEDQSESCITAARMVLSANGDYTSVPDLISEIGVGSNPNQSFVSGYGVHSPALVGMFDALGLEQIEYDATLAELIKHIDNGDPTVIFMYDQVSEPKGTVPVGSVTGYNGLRCVVLYGYEGTPSNVRWLYVKDPISGHQRYTTTLFDELWLYTGRQSVTVKFND